MEILTAGTGGYGAEDFFELLTNSGATCVVDTRLNRSSQLAGFTKERDLRYFLPRLSGVAYLVEETLAPEREALKSFRAKSLAWAEYESRYLTLMAARRVDQAIDFSKWGERPLLLCSEHEPTHCHRRLAADYLMQSLTGALVVTSVHHL